jgi:hypothetical protein
VTGSVASTLAFTLGSSANLGSFTAGIAKDYDTTVPANVLSSAGDATLSVSDPSPNAPGHLVNGAFALAQPIQVKASDAANPIRAFGPVGANPLTLLTYTGPVSNDMVTIGVRQSIGANDPLRTGGYSKTLTFTLSTTTP